MITQINQYRQQLYQEKRSRIIRKFGDMTVAAALTQFPTVKSWLFKQKASLIHPLSETIHDIKKEGSWAKFEDDKRRILLHKDDEMIIFGSDDGLTAFHS